MESAKYSFAIEFAGIILLVLISQRAGTNRIFESRRDSGILGRFRIVIPGIVSSLSSMSTLAGSQQSRTVPHS